jgi:hypothetical protein
MSIGRFAIFPVTVAACVLAVSLAAPAGAVSAHRHPALTRVPVPAAGASSVSTSNLPGVSCPSVSFCLAVGTSGAGPAAQVWNGSTWRAVSVPVSGSLSGVSCVSATGCMVVGNGRAGLTGEWWNGSTWRAANPVSPPGTVINGVSCVSASSCVAVGGNSQAFSEAWNGTAWRVLNTPNTGGPFSGLDAVSCSGTTNCMAVGWGMPDDEQQLTLAIRWNGTSWTLLSTPPDNFDISPVLYGVSCLSGSNCMAVGAGGGSDGSAPLAVRWNGSTWTELGTPGPGTWYGVSCLAGGNCIAVGTASGSPPLLAQAAEWDGGTWQGLPTANPSNVDNLYGVSCANAASCMATGDYQVPGGTYLSLDQRWDGASWQVPLTTGYLALTPDGGVANFNVSWYGSQRGTLPSGTAAIAIAPYQTGGLSEYRNGGYQILGSNGGVYNHNAPWYGSERGHLNGTPVSIAADPYTGGYWILNSNGGVDNYNAPWYGSQRGHLSAGTTARSITVDPLTGGYWILDSNGGIANFHARWFGSERGHVASPPVAVAGVFEGGEGGYAILNADGSVSGYGDITTYGGEKNGHAAGFTFDPETGGYWIINTNGGISNFAAPWFGSLAGKTKLAPTGIAGF